MNALIKAFITRSKVFEVLGHAFMDSMLADAIIKELDIDFSEPGQVTEGWEHDLAKSLAKHGLIKYPKLSVLEIVKRFDDVYHEPVKKIIDAEKDFPDTW